MGLNMSLYIDNQIDLCAAAGGRELSKMPVHFTVINLQDERVDWLSMTFKSYDTNVIRNWIWCNLVGRFCLEQTQVGFEDPAEASMFALVKDTLVEKIDSIF